MNTPAFVRAGMIVYVCLLGASCGGASPIQPPVPLQQLQIACPADQVVEASRSDGGDVRFDSPSATGGRGPYLIDCTPRPGSAIPIGETTVHCTAISADMAQAACSFIVRVRVTQTLSRTNFLAFGDSITAGAVSLVPVLMLGPPDTYPYKLAEMLRLRYPSQTFVVANHGVPGERTAQGARRLPSVLAAERPEVLLLLEGVNGVAEVATATQERNLRSMIAAAQQRGVEVIMATVMPVALNGRIQPAADAMVAIHALNARIASLADEFNMGNVVDLFAVFSANMHLLGADGVHPTREGQTRIAEAFRDEILRRYETRSTLSSRFPAATRR